MPLTRDHLKEILHAIESAEKHVHRVLKDAGPYDDATEAVFFNKHNGILADLQRGTRDVRKLLNGDI